MPELPQTMSAEQWIELRNSSWHDRVSFEDAKRYHTRNVDRVERAIAEYRSPNRPIRILAVYGSGRNIEQSCAHEESNSKLLLRTGLKAVTGDVEIDEVELRRVDINPCNCCYSTSSTWCHMPCTSVDSFEKVLTSSGWLSIGNLDKVSTAVLNGLGEFVDPIRYFRHGIKKVFKVSTVEGYEVRLTADHRVYLADGSIRRVDKLEVGDRLALPLPRVLSFSSNQLLPFIISDLNDYRPAGFIPGDKTRRKAGKAIKKRWSSRCARPDLPATWSEELGEALGYLVGNGWLNASKKSVYAVGLSMSFEDEDYGAHIGQYLAKIGGSKLYRKVTKSNIKINGYVYKDRECLQYVLYGWPLLEFFRRVGADKTFSVSDRRAPPAIWDAPESAVRGFLRGLFSAGGSVSRRCDYRNVIVHFYSASYKFSQDIQKLLFQFGIRSSISVNHRGLSEVAIRSIRGVQLFSERVGFSNPRKQKVLDSHGYILKPQPQKDYVKFTGATFVGYREVSDLWLPKEHSFCAGGIKVANCFPLDGIQDLYPKVLRSDVLLMATGVNQSMVSSRLKLFCDRLISLDGGIFVSPEQFKIKTEEWKRQWMQLAASGNFSYTPRMAGRVCGYFITSKDQNNNRGGESHYEDLVSQSLRDSFEDYGCVHADPWYALSASDPDVEMQFDKQIHNQDTKAHARAREVVLASISRAKRVREEGYEPPIDRVNRT